MEDNKQLPQSDQAPLVPAPETALPVPEEAPFDLPFAPETEDGIFQSAGDLGVDPQYDSFTDPVLGSEITPDEHAMAFHGMTHPSEPDPYDGQPFPTQEPFHDAEYRDVFGSGKEFQAMFQAEAPQEEPEDAAKSRPARKGRPKRKKGDGLLGIPHLLSTFVWLAIIVAIGVSLGRLLWVCAADVLAFGRDDKAVTITIEPEDTIDTISEKLYDAGLIQYPSLFRLYASLAVDEGEISTGTFTLNTMYDYHALVGGMSSSSSYRSVVEDVLIPEGYSCRQIFALLEEKGICTVAELEAYAASGEFADYWFLEGVERGDKYCLEGYLFPDTYDFYAGSTPREALGKMLTGFENRVTEEYTGKLDTLNAHVSQLMREYGRSEEYIAQHQLTFRDVLIVASMIEKETGNNAEGYNIASVIYNRLFNWKGYPAYLGIDATIIYVTGDPNNIDTSIDSPYNTYTNVGLTPGPISNPGLASLEAALNPADTDYYYYVLNPATGLHDFSKTGEEHAQKVEKYRGTRE